MSLRTRTPDAGHWPRSRLGGPALLLRHRRPTRGPAVVTALMVLAVAALVAATPSVFAAMTARELDQTIRSAPPAARYLVAHPTGRILTHPSADPSASGLDHQLEATYGTWLDQLATIRRGLPAPLRPLVGPARWTITTGPVIIGPTRGEPASSQTSIAPRVDIDPAAVATLVAGRWPRSSDLESPAGIALSQASASAVGARVGSTLGGYRVDGIFRPRDPHADYWALNPGMVQPKIFDDGNKPIKITVTAFVDPERWDTAAGGNPAILVWYPLDLAGLSGSRAPQTLAFLRQVVASQRPAATHLTDVEPFAQMQSIQSLTLTADVIPALEAALGRVSAARSVLTVAAVGPIAAALAVLVLAIRALQRRRRPLAGLLATRGAGPGRTRALLAADGLAVGLPPAVAAAGAIWWAFGRDAPASGLVLALAVGLVPAAMLAGTPISPALRPGRADAGIRSRSRWRWVAEVAVLALAGVSLYLLLTAGLGGAGTDLLVAAAPLLLAAAACVVVLRLYPLPLHVLSGVFRRRRAAVAFLGSTRALRDPVVGVAPVLAVLAGVSVAVFSATTLSTVGRGVDQAALAATGAPIRVTGVAVDDARYAAIRALPGVAAAAREALVGSMPIQIGDEPLRPTADVYLADVAALGRVQRGVPGAVPIPGGMVAGPVAGAVVSASLGEPGTELLVGAVPARVQGTAAGLTGLGRSPDFALLDSSVTAFGPFRPDAVLVAPARSADTVAVAAELRALLGPDASVRLASADAAALRDGAMAAGMRTALVAALAAAGIAAVAALLLTMIGSAASRARMLAILRVLGWSVRQRRAIVLWEQTPAAVVALVVGAGLGLALAALVGATVDLAPFTGGRAQPRLFIDAGLLAALLGAFVVAVAAATWIGLVATRRVTAATAVKLDEE